MKNNESFLLYIFYSFSSNLVFSLDEILSDSYKYNGKEIKISGFIYREIYRLGRK